MLEQDLSINSVQRDWRDDACCRENDPDLFYPEEAEEGMSEREVKDVNERAKETEQLAKAICKECTVKPECLESTRGSDKSDRKPPGIFGGLTGHERQKARRLERDRKRRQERKANEGV